MNKTALITGASSGIGLELAKLSASKGIDLVITARREENLLDLKKELEKKYQIGIKVIAKDLSLPGSPLEIFEEVKSSGIEIEYLINNAGFGYFGKYSETDWEIYRNMINVNITALSYLTRLFLPGMLKRNSGRILNVASTAGFIPGPLQAVYYASKAYVISLSQAIAEELRGSNVTATAFCPGATETEFQKTANFKGGSVFKNADSARDVALKGYQSMMNGELVKIISPKYSILINWALPFVPKKLILKLSRKRAEE